MKNFLLLLCAFFFQSLGQYCDTIQQQYNVYATVNEIQEWDMRKYFFTGENLKYQISEDCPYFETIDPFAEIGDATSHKDPSIGLIRSLKASRSLENGVWLNDFIFLEQNNTDVDVFYSLGDPQQMDVVPSFNRQINVRNNTKNLVCFDLDFLTNSKIIVDCYQRDFDDETKGYMNGFIVVDIADPDQYALYPNEHPEGDIYNHTEHRKIVFHNYTNKNGDRESLLFRGEPTWATENADIVINKLDDDCELEVYKFDDKFQLINPSPITILTKKVLATLLGTPESQQKFYLVDFQIEPDGSIYVLDAFNGVYVLYFESIHLQWQLKSHINPPYITQCYGFDVNYLINDNGNVTQQLVLVFQNSANFYENDQQKFTIKTPILTSYKEFQVQMSQQYLVLKINSYIYFYNSGTGEKLYTYTQDIFDQVIINPYEPDLLGINENSAYKFLISNGLLRLKQMDIPNDGIKSYTLRAISLDDPSKECQVSINVQVLKQNDILIREQSYHPFPASLTAPSGPISIDLIASGPNLKYNSLDSLQNLRGNNKVILQIKTLWDLQLNGIILPEPKDVVYSDVQVNGDLGIFYLLFQIPSKVVFIYRCSHSLIDQKQANCKDYDKLQLDQLINKTKHSFQWSVEALQITLIHQDTDYSIQIYKAAGGYFQNVGTIKVNKDSIDNKINSVTFLENEIYVVQSKLKKVQIYSKYMPFELIYEITDSKLNQFNVKGDFIPQRVFANKKAKSSLIFIQTITELFIGIFSNNKISTFVLQKEITIIPEAQIEVAIGIENFFIIQKLDDKDLIEEYNYKHMNRIYKTKDLPLFDYKLQKPLTVDYSSQTGWLFLRAKDDKQTVILVYEPGVVSHNCLQTVLECKSFIQDEQKFDMALDGSNQMFLYFNNNTDHRFLSILAKSELYAIPYLDSQDYVIDVFTGIQITNFPKNNPLIVQNRIKILNSQSIVTIKQQLFDSKQKVFKFEKQEGEQIIDMDTNWYNGQVTSFSVHCQTCGSNLSIRPNIQRVADGQDMIYGIIDGAIYGEYGQVYQTRNSIIFQDQKGQFVSKFDIKLTTQNCELITVSDDLNYIFSSWHNTKNEVGIYVSICSQQEQQKYCQQYRQGFSTIAGIQKISKIQMADKKNLIILNTNPENFDSIDNMIVVATFNYDEISFSVQKKYLINDQYVGSKFLQIGDFDIAKYSINNMSFTTIIFTDINEGLYFAHFYYDASGTISKSISELFKIQSIQDNQLHLEENTKFYQVRVIFNKVVGTILQLNILVTTNNVAHYVIAFDLDISQPTQIISIIKKNTKLLYVLTPYSTWPTIDKIAYVNGYVAIPYTDSTSLLIGIYDLPNNRPVNVITIPFTHSISANYENPLPIDFALLLTKDLESKFPNLYLNINYDSKSDEYLIEKYQLRADPQLILRNSMSLDDEVPITLQLSNDFTQSIGQAYLKINDSPPPDDDKSNSNLWWIILIGVVGLILLVVIGFYIYKKIFKKKTVYRSKIPLDE